MLCFRKKKSPKVWLPHVHTRNRRVVNLGAISRLPDFVENSVYDLLKLLRTSEDGEAAPPLYRSHYIEVII